MANEEWVEVDPLPGLPPNRRTDLGEGECAVFMKTLIPVQIEIAPPPIAIFNWGRSGRGSIAQTHHAEDLRSCQTVTP